METAAIFVLSRLRGFRAGAILAVVGSTISQELIAVQSGDTIGQTIRVGVGAMRQLIDRPE
jgi:uridine phosphorylase